jgi:hypothetical protein
LICKWTCSRCLRPRTPNPLVHCIRAYSIARGRGGRRAEPERRLEGQKFTKLGRKFRHDMSVFLDDILLWCLYSLLVQSTRVSVPSSELRGRGELVRTTGEKAWNSVYCVLVRNHTGILFFVLLLFMRLLKCISFSCRSLLP